jgi:hypothetical protein
MRIELNPQSLDLKIMMQINFMMTRDVPGILLNEQQTWDHIMMFICS